MYHQTLIEKYRSAVLQCCIVIRFVQVYLVTLDLRSHDNVILPILVPQIDPLVKLYNHGEGPY